MLHLFRQNKWDRFAFVYDDSSPWTLYEDAVLENIATTGIKMLSSHSVNSTVTDANLVKMFKNIKKYAWSKYLFIYLFKKYVSIGIKNYVFWLLVKLIYLSSIVKQVLTAYLNHSQDRFLEPTCTGVI